MRMPGNLRVINKDVIFEDTIGMFEITAKEIENLSPEIFADVINRLLRAESSRTGMSPRNVQTSLKIYEPDGGIDALVKDAPVNSHDWLPQGTSVWQFKSGGKSHSPTDLKKEFDKPEVQNALQQGGAYCIVIGKGLSRTTRKNREDALRDCCASAQLPIDSCHIFDANQASQWASEHLAVTLLPHFSRPTGDWMRWDKWKSTGNFKQEYVPDQQRQDIMAFALETLRGQNDLLHVRVEGLAGVGKTRLALELFTPPHQNTPYAGGISERMLYLLRPFDLPVGFWAWIEANAKAELILVVDECDQVVANRLEQQAQRCDGRVRLLTIGLAQEVRSITSRPVNYRLLDKLSDNTMRELLQHSAPGLPIEQVNFVVRLSSGFVKLATAISSALQRNPKEVSTTFQFTSATDITKHSEVKEVLHKFLLPKDEDFKAMQAAALLSRIGWEKEFAQEGKAVCAFLGIGWQDAERSIRRQMNEGLVSLQGRYRYVTPHLLAVWLAAEAWETYDNLIDLLSDLPTWNSRRALLERLRDLGDHESTQQVIETLLGPTGIFPDINSINDERRAEVFALLTEAHPRAGLSALERLLEYMPRDELMRFDKGRQQIVSVLGKLAWLPETFFGAARLLLALAEAENQTWANNATGTWLALFQTHFGGTAVRATDRHVLIAETLSDSSVQRSLLAVQAINAALSLHESSSIGIEPQGGRLVPSEWRPNTQQEDQEVRLSALTLLNQSLVHPVSEVRQAAEDVLLKNTFSLISFGFADDVLDYLECLHVEDDNKRWMLRQTIESGKQWGSDYLTKQQQERIEILRAKLSSHSFHHRLRHWTGKWTRGDWKALTENPYEDTEQNIGTLVVEALAQPELLQPEISWLYSDEAEHAMLFARRLGYMDSTYTWWSTFESHVADKFGPALIAAYLQGQVNAGRREWWKTVLDQWMEDAHKSEAILNAVWLSTPTDNDLFRLVQLVQRGSLSSEKLRILVWGGQTKLFSANAFRLLMDCILKDPTTAAAITAVDLLEQRLDFYPDETKTFEDFAWNALERSSLLLDDTMAEHDWNELAERYVVINPVRMARLLLVQFEAEAQVSYIRPNERMHTLTKATRNAPSEVWAEVAPHLLKQNRFSVLLRQSLRGWYADLIEAEILLSWATQHLPEGPQIVAALACVKNAPLGTLARQLLIQFGDDENVANALYATFGTGSWSGSASEYYQSRLDVAREWLNDLHPAVRKWAKVEVEALEKQVAHAKLEEAEAFV